MENTNSEKILNYRNAEFHEIEEEYSLVQKNMTENRLEFDQKNSHRWTLTLELDQNFTPTNINLNLDRNMDQFDQKYTNKNFRSYSHVNVRCCGNILVKFEGLRSLVQIFWSYWPISVIFIWSSWFGQVNLPQIEGVRLMVDN